MVNGAPITEYRFHQKPSKQITYTLEFEEALAAQEAGLTWTEYQALPGAPRWVDPDDPGESKAEVLARYRMKKRIEAVQADFPTPKGKGKK